MDEVEAFLEHHGVLGMKWGHHKAGGGSDSSKPSKPTTQEIHDARIRTAARMNQQSAQFDKLNLATTDRGRQAALKEIDRIANEGAADSKVAARSTRGEKVATSLLVAAAVGGVTVSALTR